MKILNVPYDQKDDAKALGARWDTELKKWYVPDGLDVEAFSRWLPPSKQDPLPVEYIPVDDSAFEQYNEEENH